MKYTRHFIQLALLFSLSVCSFLANATTYSLPAPGNSLLGQVQYVSGYYNDGTVNLAQRYNVGVNSIVNANPGFTEESSVSTDQIIIPTAFILPPVARRGIVINLPEMRMYYYPPNSNVVMTFPVGIGKLGKTIPVVNTAVTRKVINPVWIPTPAIRAFNEEKGIELPRVMPPGPDNPLGPYAIYMRLPCYLIHSTLFDDSIGKRASFGCIRMHENDIRQFFPMITAGTPVAIVDMPTKVGWYNNRLFMQTYPPLIERSHLAHASLNGVMQLVRNQVPRHHRVFVDWQRVAYLLEQPDGVPHEIGFMTN